MKIAENIKSLRKEKSLTQEELAEVLDVTVGAVYKWETGQSMPNIMLLPQLASYFGVTIDELLGYKPQLSKEQIRKKYIDLTAAFANESFDVVMDRSKRLVKEYYSCYSFLYQICVLWLNHYMLAESEQKQKEILEGASDLCRHIMDNCKDVWLCSDTLYLKASIRLLLGDAQAVIEDLEEMENPCRASKQGVGILTQAYLMAGEAEKADEFTQISMYLQVMSLVSSATQYIAIHTADIEICIETINRIEQIISAYKLADLHPNCVALFYYQVASCYCMHNRSDEALVALERFVECVERLLVEKKSILHGDKYFTKLDVWFEQLELGKNAPRDRRIVYESGIQSLRNPIFAILDKEESYQGLIKRLERNGYAATK